MKKTFKTQSESKGNGTSNSIRKLQSYLQGKKIKILNQTGSHNYGSNDTILKIPKNHTFSFGGGSGNHFTSVTSLTPGKNNIQFSSFVVIEDETVKDITENIKDLKREKKEFVEEIEQQIQNEELKIKFLEETDSEKFDEDEFKSYQALSLLENESLTLLEKSRILAKLIKNS